MNSMIMDIFLKTNWSQLGSTFKTYDTDYKAGPQHKRQT